jgi:hypothetical protein
LLAVGSISPPATKSMLLSFREGTPLAAATLIPAAIATPETCESLQGFL